MSDVKEKEVEATEEVVETEEDKVEDEEEDEEPTAEDIAKGMVKDIIAGIKKADAPIKKDLGANGKHSDVSKEYALVKYLQGLAVGKALMATDSDNDGGHLVPPAEFVAELYRLEEVYGVARRDATVRSTTRQSVLLNKKTSDVVVKGTAEHGIKPTTSMTFEQIEAIVEKFTGIAVLTDELDEDSAVNIWNELTNSFARAYSKLEDQLVFTGNEGLLNLAGTAKVVIKGDSIEDLTFDDLNKAIFSVPTDSMNGGKFYFNRTLLGVIQRIKDGDDNFIWAPGPNGMVDGTIWGHPYALVDVMPGLTDDDAETPFIVFGNLKYMTIIDRTGIQMTVLTEGTIDMNGGVGEADNINLGQQDAKAVRAVKRFTTKCVFENAFAVIETGNATS